MCSFLLLPHQSWGYRSAPPRSVYMMMKTEPSDTLNPLKCQACILPTKPHPQPCLLLFLIRKISYIHKRKQTMERSPYIHHFLPSLPNIITAKSIYIKGQGQPTQVGLGVLKGLCWSWIHGNFSVSSFQVLRLQERTTTPAFESPCFSSQIIKGIGQRLSPLSQLTSLMDSFLWESLEATFFVGICRTHFQVASPSLEWTRLPVLGSTVLGIWRVNTRASPHVWMEKSTQTVQFVMSHVSWGCFCTDNSSTHIWREFTV